MSNDNTPNLSDGTHYPGLIDLDQREYIHEHIIEFGYPPGLKVHLTKGEKAECQEHATIAKPGTIYVIKGADLFKIGATTKSVEQRMRQLQVGSPVLLSLCLSYYCDDVYASERKLHKHFAGRRHHGEWFDLSDEDVEFIERLLNG